MQMTVERALSASHKLSRSGKLAGAEKTLLQALERYPRNRRLREALGEVSGSGDARMSPDEVIERAEHWWREGRPDRARDCYRSVLEREPNSLAAQMGLALIDRSEGNTQSAIERYLQVISAAPTLADPYRYVTEMRQTKPDDGWIETLSAALEVAAVDAARIPLCYALGKSLDDVGAVDAAFNAFEMGNQLQRNTLGASPLLRIRELAAITQVFMGPGAERSLDLEPWGDAPRPIFIVGLPRSGTTLVERILAQHSQISAGGERSILRDAIFGSGPDLGWLDTARANRIRAAYRSAMPKAAPGLHWITDKMPSNARWVPLIRQAIPEALIIETQRDPMAVGWSIFRRCFTSDQMAFSCDLTEIGDYIRLHEAMTALWRSQAPGAVREVTYEALTDDPEKEIPTLLSDLGLTFEPECLAPEKHQGSVRTASFEQVRRPIYQGSSQEWQAYSKHLAPLAARLHRD